MLIIIQHTGASRVWSWESISTMMAKSMRLKRKIISPIVQLLSNSILSIPLVTTWSLYIMLVRIERTWLSKTSTLGNGSSLSLRCSWTRRCSAQSLTCSRVSQVISGKSSSSGHNQFYTRLENSRKMRLKPTRQMWVSRVWELIGMAPITGVVFPIWSWMKQTIMITCGYPRGNWMSISHASIILFS